jgi:hypothetical protein
MTSKMIIVTDILPSKQMTAGSVLSVFHKEIKDKYEIYYINLTNKELNYELDEQIGSASIYFYEKPFEEWQKILESNFLTKWLIFIGEIFANIDSVKISKNILVVINRIRPETVVFVIESQTSVKIAKYLIPRVKAYKIGIFWDPISWWLESKNLDRITKKQILKYYKLIVTTLDSLIVPSENMMLYFKKMGAKSVIDLYSYNRQDSEYDG